MISIFTNNLPLVKILLVIKKILPEPALPKRRGRPYIYSLPVMMCCFVIIVAKGFSVRALWEYLRRDDPDAVMIREVIEFPEGKIPNRRTFDRRLSKWSSSALSYIGVATDYLVVKKLIGIARLAIDRRMFQALGKLWHSVI